MLLLNSKICGQNLNYVHLRIPSNVGVLHNRCLLSTCWVLSDTRLTEMICPGLETLEEAQPSLIPTLCSFLTAPFCYCPTCAVMREQEWVPSLQIFNSESSHPNPSFNLDSTYLIYLSKDEVFFPFKGKKLEQPSNTLGWFSGRLVPFL